MHFHVLLAKKKNEENGEEKGKQETDGRSKGEKTTGEDEGGGQIRPRECVISRGSSGLDEKQSEGGEGKKAVQRKDVALLTNEMSRDA